MKAGELMRLRVAFGALGMVPVFLGGWFFYLQVAEAGELPRPGRDPLPLNAAVADSYARGEAQLPAPRGSIVDRNGATLAMDRESYEVRARVRVPSTKRRDLTLFRPWVERLADSLAQALVDDPEIPDRSAVYSRHRDRLQKVMWRKWRIQDLPERGKWPKEHPQGADFLVAKDVDRRPVLEALAAQHQSSVYPTLYLEKLHSFQRVYPERDLTYGVVGHTETYEVKEDGRVRLHTAGRSGLETFAALTPTSGAVRRFLKDGRHRPFFLGPVQGPPQPVRLHSTLDLELQRACMRELAAQCAKGHKLAPEERPTWAAMTLVEVATGDVLAATSWHLASSKWPEKGSLHPKAGSFAPYQNRFEPGSIVKPLVFAYALEVGAVGWDERFDCAPRGEMYSRLIGRLGRAKRVEDVHDCGVLTPHGILLNSSNIGAAMVGLRLSRDQWKDYMAAYGWGRSLGLRLPHESIGGHPKSSFDPSRSDRGFRANSAISFSFGYEMTTTALQVARAYLRLLRGLDAELHLVRGLEVEGEWYKAPRPASAGRAFRPEVRRQVLSAMRDVVSNIEGATGSSVVNTFQKQGIDLHRLVGGKTGTAFSPVREADGTKVIMRNASFVGLLPAEDPKWLAVCVMQKKGGRARFYGSSYAAPPAVKLLLRCLELRGDDELRQGPRGGSGGQTRPVDQTPGGSGWDQSVGADEVSETR